MAITIGGGFRISDANPIDDRFVVSSSVDRFTTEQARVFDGLTVYSSASNQYFLLGDKSNYDNVNGWNRVLTTGLGTDIVSGTISASVLNSPLVQANVLSVGANSLFNGPITVDYVGVTDSSTGFQNQSPISIVDIAPSTIKGNNTGSFALSGSGNQSLFSFTGSILIVSTSAVDSNGLSEYQFHSYRDAVSESTPDRPTDGIWFFSTGSGTIPNATASRNLNEKIQEVLITGSFGGPFPHILSRSLLFTDLANSLPRAISYTSSFEYLSNTIEIFYRTASVANPVKISTGSSAGGFPVYALSASGDGFFGGNVTVGSESFLRANNIGAANFGGSNNFITVTSPIVSVAGNSDGTVLGMALRSGSMLAKTYRLMSQSTEFTLARQADVGAVAGTLIGGSEIVMPIHISRLNAFTNFTSSGVADFKGNANISGTLSLGTISNVSSSLAAAIEGAGNLQTVLTNGNVTSVGIFSTNAIIISGSTGRIIGRSLEAYDAVTSSIISASGNVTANTLTLTNLSNQSSETTAVMINGSDVIGTRELGSNAFTSTTVGTTTEALTVDDATLKLNTGTTFDGSSARTISIKDGGVDSDALAADIKVTSLTASIISASSISASKISASNMDMISGSFGRISSSNVVTTNLTTTNFTLGNNLTVNGTLNATQFQVASDDASIDANGNYIGVGADFDTLDVGAGNLPGFQWHLANGTINGFAPADQAGVKLVTISGSTVRSHTGLIVDASASYVGLIANQDQTQDKPLLIARQLSGADKEVVITGSAFKIIATDGTQTFNSDGATGKLTIGDNTEQISIIGSAINLTGSVNSLNSVKTTAITSSTISASGVLTSNKVITGNITSSLVLGFPVDDNGLKGIAFGGDIEESGSITHGENAMLLRYNTSDVVAINQTEVKLGNNVTMSATRVSASDVIAGTLFVNTTFSPQAININGGDFEVNSDGALTNNKTASFTGGISSSYFRTIPAGAVDSIKISNNLISAEGSQSMGIQFDGSQKALRFFGGKTDAYVSHSVKIYGPDSGRSTFLLMSGSDFILEERDGGECFNFRGDTGDIALGRPGGGGNTLTIQAANTKVTSATFTISSSTFNISTGSQTTDPDNNATAIVVADIVTGRVYTRNSASYALNAVTASYVKNAQTASYVTTAVNANNIKVANDTGNAEHPITFIDDTSPNGGNEVLKGNANITVNPANAALTLAEITASGNISASGEIEADTFKATGNVDFNGDLDVAGAISASSVISASGGFIGDVTGSLLGNVTGTATTASLATRVVLNTTSTLNTTIEFGDISQVAPSKIYGDVVKFGTSDGALVAGNIYMLHTDGKWKQTDANSEISSSGMLGVAVTTNVANGLLVKGICDVVMANTTPTGSALYLSTQASRATHSPASGSGDVIRAIGYTLDGGSGRIYFNPDATYIVAS